MRIVPDPRWLMVKTTHFIMECRQMSAVGVPINVGVLQSILLVIDSMCLQNMIEHRRLDTVKTFSALGKQTSRTSVD